MWTEPFVSTTVNPDSIPEKPNAEPRPEPITAEELIRMAGKPVFFIGSDYNGTVRIVEWRVIDYIIVRKSGMVVLFTDSKNEYDIRRFQAFRKETYPIDKDFIECEDADYAELVSRIRDKYRRGEE